MSVPNYESSPQFISKEIQSNIWTTIKPVLSLATIATTLYVLGFIATNASLALWGIYDPEPIHTSSILTGGLFLGYIAAALVPAWVYQYAARRRGSTRAWVLMPIIFIALAYGYAALLNTAEHWSWETFFSSPRFWLLPICFTLLSCGLGIWLSYSPKVFAKERSRIDRLFIGLFAAIALFFLLQFFGAVYILVPARYGGGEPVEKEVWFSKDANPILKAMNVTTVQDGDFIKAPQLWVLYSRGDLQVFCEQKTCSKGFQVPKDWIKAQSWLTGIGISNTSNANNPTSSKPHSTP